MNLMYNFLPIYLLLEVCTSLRNYHDDRYSHHSDLPMQHYDNYQHFDQHYDSYSSDEMVMRQSPRHAPQLRSRSNRNIDFSDTEYSYKCKCSCTKCKKPKPKVKPCCEEFCTTECVVQNNILVVPYPVPFMVFNQSAPAEFPMPPMPTTLPSTTTTTTSTTTECPTTTETTTCSTTTTTTDQTTQSTVPFYQNYIKNKRFHILNQNLRRSLGNNDLRSPKFGRLPKYGIVPIPENLALSLMQQIKKDQNDDQFRRRLALNKNLLDYTRRPLV